MNSYQSMNSIKVSDLFRLEYSHSHRLRELNFFINRLKSLENPKISDIIDDLEAFSRDNICSMLYIEHSLDKLKERGIKLT